MTDLFGAVPSPRKNLPSRPVGLELILLDSLFAAWGPFAYRDLVWMLYFVEKHRRATEGTISTAFLSCVRAGWLKPLGTSLRPSTRGHVVWGLANPGKSRVYDSAVEGQREACKVWEVETGFRCICCRLGDLPDDGHDPGLPEVKEPLW